MSAYNAAFRVPDILFTLVAGGALSSAFIPVFAGLLERRCEAEAWQVANTVLNSLLLLLLLLAVAAFVLAPQITDVLVPGFPPATKAETANLTRIMLVQPVLLGVGGLFASMQNSYNRFILTAVAPVLYNVAIVLGALIFGPHFGVYAAAWAVVAGAVIMFEVQLWGVATESSYYRAAIDWRLSEAREVLKLLLPRLIGLSAFQFMLLVTTFLASGLTSAGFNAVTYAWTLVMFPVGAVGSAVGTAVFPTLSRQSAGAQVGAMLDTVRRSVRAILFLALPATVGLMILRRPIIMLLFAHGAWTGASTDATAFALLFYAIAVAPLTVIEVVARAFYALKNTRTPVVIAVGAALLDAALSIVLIRSFSKGRGQGGLALATAISVWIQVYLLTRALMRHLPSLIDRDFKRALGGTVLSTIAMAGCVFVALRLSETFAFGGVFLRSLTESAVSIAVGMVSYVFVAQLLGVPDVARLTGIFNRSGSRGNVARRRRWE